MKRCRMKILAIPTFPDLESGSEKEGEEDFDSGTTMIMKSHKKYINQKTIPKKKIDGIRVMIYL